MNIRRFLKRIRHSKLGGLLFYLPLLFVWLFLTRVYLINEPLSLTVVFVLAYFVLGLIVAFMLRSILRAFVVIPADLYMKQVDIYVWEPHDRSNYMLAIAEKSEKEAQTAITKFLEKRLKTDSALYYQTVRSWKRGDYSLFVFQIGDVLVHDSG